jgi:indole-3-pyruvate monooxygenase
VSASSDRFSAIVIGAGPAGLAVGASLRVAGVPFVILERAERVASSWRNHYERLHLHTTKSASELPFLSFPKHYPRYPSRHQVVEYLEAYARHFRIEPIFGQEVRLARRVGPMWGVAAADTVYRAPFLVIASGINAEPFRPSFEGEVDFGGEIIHSAEYREGSRFRGRRVLVVGLGNSGAEIAIDLHENGSLPTVAVRGPLVVMPRDLLGIPLTSLGVLGRVLPPDVADAAFRQFLRLVVGDLSRFGLRSPPYGPLAQIRTRGRVPLIDVGTIQLIKNGHVQVRPGVVRFHERGAAFQDGRVEDFDAVVLATGFLPTWNRFLELPPTGTVASGASPQTLESTVDGLYFCGLTLGATGMLREIGEQARRIAASITGSIGIRGRIQEHRSGRGGAADGDDRPSALR